MILMGCLNVFGGLMFLFAAGVSYIVLGTIPVGEAGIDNNLFLLLRYGVTGIFALASLVFLIPGIRSFKGAREKRQLAHELIERGVETTATVTYVDRNYRLLVNNAPIYSILEYEYVDGLGRPQMRRIETVPTESIIRSGIQVGSEINIRYHPDKMDESGWVIEDNEKAKRA